MLIMWRNTYSHIVNGQEHINQPQQPLKEPFVLIFFRGGVFEFTHNSEGNFIQSQSAILFELPSQKHINNWSKIKVILSPYGIKYAEFDPDTPKYLYFERGFQ